MSQAQGGASSKLEVAQDAVVSMDQAGRITGFNLAAERMFGHSREDALGKPLIELVRASHQESPRGLLVESVKERQELEQESQRLNQANRLTSEFLANISHELRTPLNAIMGFAELMFRGKVGPVSDDHREYLGDILDSSRHLLQVINDVLDVAKIDSGQIEFRPEALDLAKVIAEVGDTLSGLAATKRIRIDTDVDPSSAAAVLDPSKLKQVLYNYLSNALKFTPDSEGGN